MKRPTFSHAPITTARLLSALALCTAPAALAQSDPGLFSTVINIDSPANSPTGASTVVTDGTQVNLFDGGTIFGQLLALSTDPDQAPTEVNVYGGTLGVFQADTGSMVNVLGGQVNTLRPNFARSVLIAGGTISKFQVSNNSVVQITGGQFRRDIGLGNPFEQFTVDSGSRVGIEGGSFAVPLIFESGTTLTLSGGVLGEGVNVDDGVDATLIGNEFYLNGTLIDPATTSGSWLTRGDVLSGTLADGTVFVWRSTQLPSDTALVAAALGPADLTPMVIDNGVAPPAGLRPGQSLTLRDGGTIGDSLSASNATVTIEGGQVGRDLRVSQSQLTISGGTFDSQVTGVQDSSVLISGGTLESVLIDSGSTATITGGQLHSISTTEGGRVLIRDAQITNGLRSGPGGEINMTGGTANTVGDNFGTRGVVNISGGTIGGGPRPVVAVASTGEVNISGGDLEEASKIILPGGTMNLLVLDLSIGGNAVDLSSGELITIDMRDGSLLEATLADGSLFTYELSTYELVAPTAPIILNYVDGIAEGGTLTARLVPEPGSALLLLAGASLLSVRRRRASN